MQPAGFHCARRSATAAGDDAQWSAPDWLREDDMLPSCTRTCHHIDVCMERNCKANETLTARELVDEKQISERRAADWSRHASSRLENRRAGGWATGWQASKRRHPDDSELVGLIEKQTSGRPDRTSNRHLDNIHGGRERSRGTPSKISRSRAATPSRSSTPPGECGPRS
jgi:hypothetical protein